MLVHNQLVTSYIARGGQAVAEAGRQAAGYANIGRAARGMGRDASLAEKQMRAFGTTLRYAFAGSVLFGVSSMVGKLNQLQQQIGLISAIAGPSGVKFGAGFGLGDLQDSLAAASVDARTNITDLNSSVINFMSTVQGADPKKLAEIVSQIGIAAKLSQTPTEDLTKAVTTLNIAAGRPNNLENINDLLKEWFSLVSKAPGGIAAAPQIAQQLGPLASVAQMGRLTPEQLFGFSQGALRFGATPSVALRGTQYFLQSLFHPPSEKAQDAMKAAGLTPELLNKVGGTEFARRYLTHVRELGGTPTEKGTRRFGALADTMMNPDAAVGDEFAPNLDIPGLSPKAIEFLSTSLGRIHGIRTALVLLKDPTMIDRYIKNFTDLRNDMGKEANQLEEAADRYRNATPLQAAAIALDSLRTTVARDLGFLLDPTSRVIGAGAQFFTERPGARKIAAGAGGLFLTAMAAEKMFSGKLSLRRLFGMGGQGIVTAQAANAIASGGMGLGATPLNPMYVTVVGQIFGGGGGGGGDSILDEVAKGAGAAGGWAGFRALLRKKALAARGIGLAMTGAWIAGDVVADKAGFGKSYIGPGDITTNRFRENWQSLTRKGLDLDRIKRLKSLSNMKMKFPQLFAAVRDMDTADPFTKQVLDQYLGGDVTPTAAERRLQSMALKQGFAQNTRMNQGLAGRQLGTIDGAIDLNIKLTDKDSVVFDKKIEIPLPEWFKGGKVPSTRGRRNSVQLDFTAPQTRNRNR